MSRAAGHCGRFPGPFLAVLAWGIGSVAGFGCGPPPPANQALRQPGKGWWCSHRIDGRPGSFCERFRVNCWAGMRKRLFGLRSRGFAVRLSRCQVRARAVCFTYFKHPRVPKVLCTESWSDCRRDRARYVRFARIWGLGRISRCDAWD